MGLPLEVLNGAPSNRYRKLSKVKADRFLVALEECAMNVSAACLQAKVSRSKVYAQREVDPDFRSDWQEVEDKLLDELEEKQWKDARVNPEDRRWVLARRRKQRWSASTEHTVSGEVSHTHTIEALPTAQLEQILASHLGQKDLDALLERESVDLFPQKGEAVHDKGAEIWAKPMDESEDGEGS